MVKTNRTVDKRQQNIKKKLTSAIVMLLVSCIMVVTSTYAWFTLSTAPEVKGIQTTVGGNGNLEIALAYTDTENGKDSWTKDEDVEIMDTDKVADSMLDNNIAWGNLIDLSKGYGLDLVTLYPSKLNESNNKVTNTMSNLLLTPIYGQDGRVTKLDANTLSGIFNSTTNTFNLTESARGVRAIGTSTSMSARQLGYLAAVSSINSKIGSTLSAIKGSLNETNGGALAGIAIKHGTGVDTAGYSSAEIQSIGLLLDGLSAATESIEDAILEVVNGYAASKLMQTLEPADGRLTDAQYDDFLRLLRSDGFSLNSLSVSGNDITVTYQVGDQKVDTPLTFTNALLASTIDKYNQLLVKINGSDDVEGAKDYYDDIKDKDNATWDELSPVFNTLMNTTGVTVLGMTMEQIRSNSYDGPDKEQYKNSDGSYMNGMNVLMQKAIANGMKVEVELSQGSGIYYDMAEFVGGFYTSVVFPDVEAMSVNLKGLPAKMVVKYEETSLLSQNLNAVTNAGQPDNNTATTDKNLSDYFGYAIDLLFRTNAANSSLLLSEAKQRIYSDSTNESTMGGGSSMTFTSAGDENFTVGQMTELMKSIRIVFIDDLGNIVKKAALDTANARQDGDSITADIKVLDSNGVFVPDEVSAEGVKTNKDVITALEQNKVLRLTVLVYLDGDTVENADVAITPQSMTGTMNLQFESDADLVPMNYTELKEGTGTSTPDAGGEDTPNA